MVRRALPAQGAGDSHPLPRHSRRGGAHRARAADRDPLHRRRSSRADGGARRRCHPRHHLSGTLRKQHVAAPGGDGYTQRRARHRGHGLTGPAASHLGASASPRRGVRAPCVLESRRRRGWQRGVLHRAGAAGTRRTSAGRRGRLCRHRTVDQLPRAAVVETGRPRRGGASFRSNSSCHRAPCADRADLWGGRHDVRRALEASDDIRDAAVIRGCDCWPIVREELAGIALLQWPWSARAMDEAGAALDALKPGVAVTYAEAGGWGRALDARIPPARHSRSPAFSTASSTGTG